MQHFSVFRPQFSAFVGTMHLRAKNYYGTVVVNDRRVNCASQRTVGEGCG